MQGLAACVRAAGKRLTLSTKRAPLMLSFDSNDWPMMPSTNTSHALSNSWNLRPVVTRAHAGQSAVHGTTRPHGTSVHGPTPRHDRHSTSHTPHHKHPRATYCGWPSIAARSWWRTRRWACGTWCPAPGPCGTTRTCGKSTHHAQARRRTHARVTRRRHTPTVQCRERRGMRPSPKVAGHGGARQRTPPLGIHAPPQSQGQHA